MADISSSLLSVYSGDKPYVFVSYAHADTVRVESVLRLLGKNGIRFWYDEGITGGHEWSEEIEYHFNKSSMFLCFLSNGIEQRGEIIKEINLAIERKRANEDYEVLFVFLERMSANVFEGEANRGLREFISRVQHIRYDGITARFASKLFGKDVFADDLVKEEYLKKWQDREYADLAADIDEAFADGGYICPGIAPGEDPSGGFYRVQPDQTDSDAVCLICLDNQWCPAQFYKDEDFLRYGLDSEKILSERTSYQRRELLRALLHARQVIINRAYLFNSSVFRGFYEDEGRDKEAFCSLLSDGSLLVYLTLEDTPYDPQNKPAFAAQYYDLWGDITKENRVYCLRIDWNDPASNRQKIEQLIFSRFGNFCLTARENRQRLDDMEAAFSLFGEDAIRFEELWQKVQQSIIERDRDGAGSYTREMFYREYIIKEGTKASACLIDEEKAFAPALKEIVDLQYGLNLPEALGARAIYPPYGHLKEFFRSSERIQSHTKELKTDVLTFAIGQFEPDFLSRKVRVPKAEGLTLSDVYHLRKLPSWKKYMRSISNAAKRARLQEIDLDDTAPVWVSYYEWMDEAFGRSSAHIVPRAEGEESPDVKQTAKGRKAEQAAGIAGQDAGQADDDASICIMKEGETYGALSVIFRLGCFEITAVYHGNDACKDIIAEPEKVKNVSPDKDRPVLLTIDYVCADILRYPVQETQLLCENRLYEGITADKLTAVYNAVLRELKRQPHRMVSPAQAQLISAGPKEVSESVCAAPENGLAAKTPAVCADPGKGLYASTPAVDAAPGKSSYEEMPAAGARPGKAPAAETSASDPYCELMKARPELFADDPMLKIETAPDMIKEYERKLGEKGGVCYESPYSIMVRDLVKNADGRYFFYERLIPAAEGPAIVCVPVWRGRFVLLDQFRHAIRDYQYSFPRGFGENGLSGEENAKKELNEELGAKVRKIWYLGEVSADSGMSAAMAKVYICDISKPEPKKGYEGIRGIVIWKRKKLLAKIKEGKITDGFTLAALKLLEATGDDALRNKKKTQGH